MRRPATISLASFPTLPADAPDRLRRTLNRMQKTVDQAAAVKSDLVAFPEICNVLGADAPWSHAEPLDGPTISALSAKAREHGIYVVAPLLTLEEGRHYNSAVLIDRNGEISGVYHKNCPTHNKLDSGVTPGTQVPVFETDFGRVGLCICFDLNYWEVGSALAANRAELVLWPSMWPGGRMLGKWAMEFGFHLGAIYTHQSTLVDVAGREILSVARAVSTRTGRVPLVTATIDMDRRLLHHDYNLDRMQPLFAKYGESAAFVEWLAHECLVVFGSDLKDVPSDALIAEFGLETMVDYLARVRRDRAQALEETRELVAV